jgi:ferrous iron transport protein A
LPTILPLELLTVGQRGRICELSGEHEFVNRLREMGLRQDVEIRMVQPGSPCIVAMGDQRLSIRTEENVMILVEVSRDKAVLGAGVHDHA